MLSSSVRGTYAEQVLKERGVDDVVDVALSPGIARYVARSAVFILNAEVRANLYYCVDLCAEENSSRALPMPSNHFLEDNVLIRVDGFL